MWELRHAHVQIRPSAEERATQHHHHRSFGALYCFFRTWCARNKCVCRVKKSAWYSLECSTCGSSRSSCCVLIAAHESNLKRIASSPQSVVELMWRYRRRRNGCLHLEARRHQHALISWFVGRYLPGAAPETKHRIARVPSKCVAFRVALPYPKSSCVVPFYTKNYKLISHRTFQTNWFQHVSLIRSNRLNQGNKYNYLITDCNANHTRLRTPATCLTIHSLSRYPMSLVKIYRILRTVLSARFINARVVFPQILATYVSIAKD